MNVLSHSTIVCMRLSKKTLRSKDSCLIGFLQASLRSTSTLPPAAAFGSRELRLSMVTASHGLLNSLTFFCVSGSWFHASGPSQPPTERSHNNKRSAGEAECSSVSSAESLVVFTANRIPFQWVSAVFLEAPFYHTDCLVCRKLYRKK